LQCVINHPANVFLIPINLQHLKKSPKEFSDSSPLFILLTIILNENQYELRVNTTVSLVDVIFIHRGHHCFVS